MKKSSPQPPSEDPGRLAGLDDPFAYASILGGFLGDRNPLQALLNDFARMLHMAINLKKNRHLAQGRIDHLQSQMRRVEEQVAGATPKVTGNRFDRLR